MLQFVVQCTDDVAGRWPATSWVHYTTSCNTQSGAAEDGQNNCHRPATSWVHYTTSCNTHSSVPEDGQNKFPKNVELTGIINKPLLLHLVGCLYYLYQ